MVKVRAGERKKQLIIDTCKELFYHNGFNNTTYEMICAKADIAPGSITYHFTSKLDIAIAIATENDEKLRQYVSTIAKEDEIGHWAFTVLMIWARWYVFLADSNMRRFFSEIYVDGFHLENMLSIFRMHMQYCSLEKTDDELKLMSATFIGQDRLILKMLDRDPHHFTLEQITEYILFTLFMLMRLDTDVAQHASERGAALFHEFQDRFNLDYFKEFKYQE